MVMKFILQRMDERSTWAGIGAALGSAVPLLVSVAAPHDFVLFVTYSIVICGIIAALLPGGS
jgi:uncharacterized membrane protein